MAKRPKKPWFVADPIHKILDVGAAHLKELIKSPEFQRLRRISQLGLASYVFPGAVHTRFAHSLGAAHLATRVTRHLRTIHGDVDIGKHAQLIERAALLHDIGHGPFSHSFERALAEIVGKKNAPNHEDWTRKIVTDRFPVLPEESKRQIADIVAPESKSSGVSGAPLLARDIVSSQLDVDRMDYLVRDAHFTGVSAGAIDLDYLIQSLRIVQHGAEKTLGIVANGVVSYEGFLFGRHCMNRSVYHHRTVATFECMMERCLRRIVTTDTQLRTLPAFFEKLRQKPPASKDAFLDEFLDSYLELTEDHVWAMLNEASQGEGELARLSQMLLRRERLERRRVAPGRERLLEQELKRQGLLESCAIVDLGSVLYKQRSDSRVFVIDAEGGAQPRDVSEISSLVDAFRDRDEAAYLLVMFNQEKDVERVADGADCLVPAPGRKLGPGVAKARHRGAATEPANDVSKAAAGHGGAARPLRRARPATRRR